jgi:fatty-acyl-CoA synthase
MRLTDYLDKGASLGPTRPCLTVGDRSRSYADVQAQSFRVAQALAVSGVRPGDKVAILSANDPVAFATVFGIARAGAVWCPINPRNEARENRDLLDLFDCTCLIFQQAFAPLVDEVRRDLPRLTALVCLDGKVEFASSYDEWVGSRSAEQVDIEPLDDIAMIVGTGGTTGTPRE